MLGMSMMAMPRTPTFVTAFPQRLNIFAKRLQNRLLRLQDGSLGFYSFDGVSDFNALCVALIERTVVELLLESCIVTYVCRGRMSMKFSYRNNVV